MINGVDVEVDGGVVGEGDVARGVSVGCVVEFEMAVVVCSAVIVWSVCV